MENLIMKQKPLVMRLKAFLTASAMVMGTLAGAQAQVSDFLGSSSASWVGYAGGPAPTLVTTTPGSIVDTTAGGGSFGRFSTALSSHPASSWRVGDSYAFHFDGVVSNATTFRLEFTDTAHAVALQFTLNNSSSANADSLVVNALGGGTSLLFSGGNFGGAAGASQRLFGDVTLSIVSSSTASLTGSVSDNVGTLWTGTGTTINLGASPAAIYPGIGLLSNGNGVSGITVLNFALTPVPEPSTATLFAGVGVAFLVFGRRLIRRNV